MINCKGPLRNMQPKNPERWSLCAELPTLAARRKTDRRRAGLGVSGRSGAGAENERSRLRRHGSKGPPPGGGMNGEGLPAARWPPAPCAPAPAQREGRRPRNVLRIVLEVVRDGRVISVSGCCVWQPLWTVRPTGGGHSRAPARRRGGFHVHSLPERDPRGQSLGMVSARGRARV